MIKELDRDWHGQETERARKSDTGQRVPRVTIFENLNSVAIGVLGGGACMAEYGLPALAGGRLRSTFSKPHGRRNPAYLVLGYRNPMPAQLLYADK